MDREKLASELVKLAKELVAKELYDVVLEKLPEGHPKKRINKRPLSWEDAFELRDSYKPSKRRFIEIRKITINGSKTASSAHQEFRTESNYGELLAHEIFSIQMELKHSLDLAVADKKKLESVLRQLFKFRKAHTLRLSQHLQIEHDRKKEERILKKLLEHLES